MRLSYKFLFVDQIKVVAEAKWSSGKLLLLREIHSSVFWWAMVRPWVRYCCEEFLWAADMACSDNMCSSSAFWLHDLFPSSSVYVACWSLMQTLACGCLTGWIPVGQGIVWPWWQNPSRLFQKGSRHKNSVTPSPPLHNVMHAVDCWSGTTFKYQSHYPPSWNRLILCTYLYFGMYTQVMTSVQKLIGIVSHCKELHSRLPVVSFHVNA